MFSSDFKELLSAFNEHHVKYLIVGGYAVAIHAQPVRQKIWTFSSSQSLEMAKQSMPRC
jgi:hypothetical protein